MALYVIKKKNRQNRETKSFILLLEYTRGLLYSSYAPGCFSFGTKSCVFLFEGPDINSVMPHLLVQFTVCKKNTTAYSSDVHTGKNNQKVIVQVKPVNKAQRIQKEHQVHRRRHAFCQEQKIRVTFQAAAAVILGQLIVKFLHPLQATHDTRENN
jgi:hypothetical protein